VGLALKVMDVRHGTIRVCGHSRKDSMAHPHFELDPDYHFPEPVGTCAAILLRLLVFKNCVLLWLR
jgi:hypothetical protein